jgi:hypothetical protein
MQADSEREVIAVHGVVHRLNATGLAREVKERKTLTDVSR